MGAMLGRWNRVRSFFRQRRQDAELDAEIGTHLELAVEENMRKGMPEPEARRRALVRFGGVQQAKEQIRDVRGLPWLDVLFQDLRYTVRTLRRDRMFTLVAVLMLALGIGANVAVFSVVNTILLRPLPFPNPQQLLWMGPAEGASGGGFSNQTYTADAYDEFRAENSSFQDVAGYFAFSSSDNQTLTGRGEPMPVTGIAVTGNFFATLGVRPALGRLFLDAEATKGGRPVVLLTNPYWRRQFGSDPAIVGKAIDIDGAPMTVVGVLPASFDFGSVFSPGAKIDLFTPAYLDDMRSWGNVLALFGRLKPNVAVAQAQAEANTLIPQLYFNVKYASTLGVYRKRPMQLKTLKEYVSGRLRRSLILLWSAVGMILLIVCVNLSNLLLARAAARSKEFAMRSALGAGRARLIRQLLTESLVLSSAGAILGLGIAFAVTAYLARQESITLPFLSSLRIDGTALAWTLGITVISAALFGLAPSLRISGGNLQEALKDSGHGISEGRKHERLRSALVVAEIALTCVLLVGAGLLMHSFLNVLDVDLGFQPSHVAAVAVDYYNRDGAQRGVRYQEILRRVIAIPGIEAAGLVDYLPLERNRTWDSPRIKGKVYLPGELPGAFVYMITPGYIEAMGMRLRGRDFTWEDGPNGEHVIMLNEVAARALFPGEDAVGRMVVMNGVDRHVIAVLKDVHEVNVEGQPGWQAYFPAMQEGPAALELVVRTKLPPGPLAASLMGALRQLNPNQPSAEVRPIGGIVDRAVSPRRFFMLLVTCFALLALILSALGIYGVISYSVARRTQEIGIRMALGASPGRVQLGVISNTLTLTLIGMLVGLLASVGVARVISTLLFGTSPTDPATFATVILLLSAVALIAGYVPARRASRIDPMIALRNN